MQLQLGGSPQGNGKRERSCSCQDRLCSASALPFSFNTPPPLHNCGAACAPPRPSAPLLVALDPANNRLPRCILIILQVASIPAFRSRCAMHMGLIDRGMVSIDHSNQQQQQQQQHPSLLLSALRQLQLPLPTSCCNAAHTISASGRLTGCQGENRRVHYASYPALPIASSLRVRPFTSAPTSPLQVFPPLTVPLPLNESAT